MTGVVPTLRFKQDDGSNFPTWKKCKFGIFVEEFKQNSTKQDEYEVLTSARSGLIRQKDYYDNDRITERINAGFNIIPCNYMTYRSRSDNRRFYFNENNLGITGIISTYYPVFKIKNGINKFFIELLFYHQHKIGQYSVGTSQTVLSINELKKIYFSVPSLPEQQKIAGFLSSVDAKIDAVKRKLSAFERFKKGLMQQIFSQKIRFKQDNGSDFPEWEEKRLGDVFQRITRKNTQNCLNVLTISAQHGLINQEKYFTKSVSAKNVANYYLLKKGEFAYNKSYSNGFPMGAIKKLNNYPEGVVSTLYICFTTKDTNYSTYFEKFFDSGGLNREIAKIAQEGARNHGLLNIGINDFFDLIYFLVPSPQEQQKIADFLSSIDVKIDAIKTQVEKLEAFKIGLLQQMFV